MSNNIVGSPYAQTVPESPAESSRTRMSHLSSLISTLRAKYNITQSSSYFDNHISGDYHAAPMREEDRAPTSTVWINLPNISPPFLTDDELMTMCNLAIGNVGSVVRLARANMQMGCCWFIECSNVDAAVTVLKNLRDVYYDIVDNVYLLNVYNDIVDNAILNAHELRGPHTCFILQKESTWETSCFHKEIREQHSGAKMPEVGVRKTDGYDSSMVVGLPSGAGHAGSGAAEQMWMYKKPEIELHSGQGNIPCMPIATQGPNIAPPQGPQQIQAPPFMRPVYLPPSSSWDTRCLNHHLPLNPTAPGVMPYNLHGNAVAAPFLPASVTPLAQMQGNSMQHFDQMFSLPVVHHFIIPTTSFAWHATSITSISTSSASVLPPLVPLHQVLPSTHTIVLSNLQYQWQGTLSKSGVNYCTIIAHRVDSDICKYLSNMSEPTEWPAKLDMTKRTDFRHVKSTFTGTPPHKRRLPPFAPFAQIGQGHQSPPPPLPFSLSLSLSLYMIGKYASCALFLPVTIKAFAVKGAAVCWEGSNHRNKGFTKTQKKFVPKTQREGHTPNPTLSTSLRQSAAAASSSTGKVVSAENADSVSSRGEGAVSSITCPKMRRWLPALVPGRRFGSPGVPACCGSFEQGAVSPSQIES
ncbi:hypothetical protein CK203_080829 [Vitis vinifera]|uniref:Spen paralogue and orthologue SPOC C-terminal domain-containing protein n=1 Tax=Vitis vinifera TaxID=29760 RepID=A0A438F7Z8_VITVI|nr:hypothetical protein CK203_080829 [Vitis vinifera]